MVRVLSKYIVNTCSILDLLHKKNKNTSFVFEVLKFKFRVCSEAVPLHH